MCVHKSDERFQVSICARPSESSVDANFRELRKAEVQLRRITKRRSSQNLYSTHSGELGEKEVWEPHTIGEFTQGVGLLAHPQQ